ncbi:hypothetical protein [Actinoplanes couchii]|uniref:Uncharacterized protein n=1 Tax=Actinoplanes couchii TaxID=403638 RepID=A0ABQ3XHX5_9ACTN|nr:hypothetical protein [Actinoplanes couchii]MDR6317714.1 hypothetical protein [Actinoplanes couchii]GID58098.1 hypothetical protein Aco03nite_065020 [Actinoplanes couchii]
MGISDRIHIRLFVEASSDRSTELASALADRLAGYGRVQVHEIGTYAKNHRLLEFNVDLTPTDSASACIGQLRAFGPAGWSGDVWRHQPQGPIFLLSEVRWVWLADGNGLAEDDWKTRLNPVAAAAATVLLAVISFWGTSLFGLALASCDREDRPPAGCAESGFWFSSDGHLYSAFGGLGIAVFGAWVWPRRARWAWLSAGYLIAFAGFAINVAVYRGAL